MKKLFTKEHTDQLVNIGGVVLLAALTTILNSRMTNNKDVIPNYNSITDSYEGQINYSDVIKAITDSDMFSHDKNKTISVVKVNGNSEYYKAIKTIIESDMYSDSKFIAISNINKSR